VVGPECPKGCSRGAPSGVPTALVFGPGRGRPSASHIRIGFPIRTSLLSGEPEDRSWWMPGRSWIRFFGAGSSAVWFFGAGTCDGSDSSGPDPRRSGSSESDRQLVWMFRNVPWGSGSSSSASRGTQGQKSGNRFQFGSANRVLKRRKAHESSGRGGPRSAAVRISAESKALELRGIVTSWSSEQEHAMSETA
jgi:hypothetical protein